MFQPFISPKTTGADAVSAGLFYKCQAGKIIRIFNGGFVDKTFFINRNPLLINSF